MISPDTRSDLLCATDLVLHAGAATLLDNVSVQLRCGEVLGVVGPNGAGKSSLLKVLAGVSRPDSGELLLDGIPANALAATKRARMLSYLEQGPRVFWPFTVRQVVSLGRLPWGSPSDAAGKAAIEEALANTDTAVLQERGFHTLSEGEKMRVHLARVLAAKPRIILADEPTAALDLWHQWQVMELLRTMAAQGTGIVVVLHDLALAARFCDSLLLLDRGGVVCSGAAAQVLSPANLAAVWHIDAELGSDTLTLHTRGRLQP